MNYSDKIYIVNKLCSRYAIWYGSVVSSHLSIFHPGEISREIHLNIPRFPISIHLQAIATIEYSHSNYNKYSNYSNYSNYSFLIISSTLNRFWSHRYFALRPAFSRPKTVSSRPCAASATKSSMKGVPRRHSMTPRGFGEYHYVRIPP